MNNPRVGVAIIVRNEKGEILLGHRKSNLGYHTWGFPGGKLDFGEEMKDCAVRELKEETNLTFEPNKLKLAGVSNAIFDEETHYITVIYEVDMLQISKKELKKELSNLTIVEPDKCEEWKFFKFKDFPKELFLPLKNFVYNLPYGSSI